MSIILTPFAKLLLLFYDITGSYGVALILFSLVIRLVLFPVFLKGRKGMLGMSGLAEKQKVLSQVLDKLDVDPMIKNFCSLLAEKERLPLFEEIAEAFGKLLDEAWGVVRGKLLTAVSLSKEQQAGILARLEKQTSKQIALKFEVDPSILGGGVLQVGDNVLDASLRAQLAILRDIIKRGE